MMARLTGMRFALLSCTAILALSPAPALADDGIPSGAPRSPLLNAVKPFTQKLIIYEEFGVQPIPTTFGTAYLPAPTHCGASPSGVQLDEFLKLPLSPAPTRIFKYVGPKSLAVEGQ